MAKVTSRDKVSKIESKMLGKLILSTSVSNGIQGDIHLYELDGIEFGGTFYRRADITPKAAKWIVKELQSIFELVEQEKEWTQSSQ